MARCGAGWCCGCCGERESRTPEELTILGETREGEEDEILPRKDYESLDYDRCINDPYLEVLESMNNKKSRRYEAVKWIVVFAIGVCTGLVGLFVDFFVRLFSHLKFSVVQTCILYMVPCSLDASKLFCFKP
uniref:Chloride voltage-gated channel 6 n=1 Tax=Sphenodon punctatus TaxID=8508 RepID=A0A8D0GZ76_SPHPU